jgi:hypothetical protein
MLTAWEFWSGAVGTVGPWPYETDHETRSSARYGGLARSLWARAQPKDFHVTKKIGARAHARGCGPTTLEKVGFLSKNWFLLINKAYF